MTDAQASAPGRDRRFVVERAVFASQLPPVCRHLLMVIASHINAGTGEIPDRNQPSLTRLCRFTGWHRSTVCRRLDDLERGGWLIRKRPPRWMSSTQHARTRYTVTIPGEQPEQLAEVVPIGGHNGQLVTAITEAFRARGKTVSPDWAAGLVPELLKGCRIPSAAENYVRTKVAGEQDLARWLPVPRNPSVSEVLAEQKRLHERPE